MNAQRLSFVLLAAAFAAGCTANVEAPKAELGADLAFDDTDTPADSRTRHLDIRGTIDFGGIVEGTFATEGYVGYLFTASAGTELTINAHSDEDTVIYLYGPQTGRSWNRATSIAMNDDANRRTYDSLITKRLRSAGTYLIVVAEYSDSEGEFLLSLDCSGRECRQECGADSACPTGSECNNVVCIRAPCPSWCAPIFTPPPTVCGTRGAASCEAGQFCNFGDVQGCGATDRGGVCETIPDGCYKILAPVCGCDGVTYDNDCYAHAAGVSVASTGRCEVPVGTACGARAGNTCSDTQYCAFTLGDSCGWADAQGTCQTRPEACITLYRPVCGCDGVTHSNSCAAANAGTSVLHDGPCEPVDCRTTGCEPGSNCQGCRGPDGGIFACIPDGAVC